MTMGEHSAIVEEATAGRQLAEAIERDIKLWLDADDRHGLDKDALDDILGNITDDLTDYREAMER